MHAPRPRSPSLLVAAVAGAWLLPLLLGACTSQPLADGTPPVSTSAVPGPPGMPNPSATDPSPRGYGPTSTVAPALGGGPGGAGARGYGR